MWISGLTSLDFQKLDFLMNYLLVDSENLTDKKRAFKFPNVAAELLSVPNEKIVAFFSQATAEGRMLNVDRLLDFFGQTTAGTQSAELNYTRASYVCKVLSALLLEKSGTFSNYIFQRHSTAEDPLQAILASSSSKSVSGFVFSLLTLLPTSQQLPISMGGNSMLPDAANQALSQAQSSVAKANFDARLQLFARLIDLCVESASNPQLTDLHANLANVVMIIINKDFQEQPAFMHVLFSKLESVVSAFCATFNDFSNNKLGNAYLVLLEVFLKESAQKSAVPGTGLSVLASNPAILTDITKRYLALLSSYLNNIDSSKRQPSLTPSYSSEIKRLNPKIYKVMEALIVTLKTQSNTGQIDSQMVLDSGLQRVIFKFFEAYPFNNILHNQVKKLLLLLIEKASPELLTAYFVENPEFMPFLERLSNNPYVQPSGRVRVRTGYIGHVINIISALIAKGDPVIGLLSSREITSKV